MRIVSVKELPVQDEASGNVTSPKPRLRPWRLIGLCLVTGVSVVAWLAIFWAIGYYL